MDNPWLEINLEDYEEHMASEDVFQLQTLNRIVKEQIRYKKPVVAYLGAAGGNGLEHIRTAEVEKVYAFDINKSYLASCVRRYGFLKDRLQTVVCDLADDSLKLPFCNLLICNLVIEYLGVKTFAGLVQRNARNLEIVSAVIQKDKGHSFVSDSGRAEKLKALDGLHKEADEGELTEALHKAGFARILRKVYPLPNGKEFVRLDYRKR